MKLTQWKNEISNDNGEKVAVCETDKQVTEIVRAVNVLLEALIGVVENVLPARELQAKDEERYNRRMAAYEKAHLEARAAIEKVKEGKP